MAMRTYIEHQGERIYIDTPPRFHEYTCDACGEFADPQYLVHTTVTIHGGKVGQVTHTYGTHLSCLPRLLDVIAGQLVEASLPS